MSYTILVSCSFNYFSGQISYQNKTSRKQQRETDVASAVTAQEARKTKKTVFAIKSPVTDDLSMIPTIPRHIFYTFHVLSSMGGSELHGKGNGCYDRP